MLKKKGFLLIMFICLLFVSCASSETKNIAVGETGITMSVDSSCDVITYKNKGSYTQEVQNLFDDQSQNQIVIYSSGRSYFLLNYDEGKNLAELEMSNKKNEDIIKTYKKYFSDYSIETVYGNYDLSIYDSGNIKWVLVHFVNYDIYLYTTVQNQKQLSVTFPPLTTYTQSKREAIVDSVRFGSPSLWSQIKNIINSITEFGYSILGRLGVYTIWSVIFVAFISIISMIHSVFTKNRK